MNFFKIDPDSGILLVTDENNFIPVLVNWFTKNEIRKFRWQLSDDVYLKRPSEVQRDISSAIVGNINSNFIWYCKFLIFSSLSNMQDYEQNYCRIMNYGIIYP